MLNSRHAAGTRFAKVSGSSLFSNSSVSSEGDRHVSNAMVLGLHYACICESGRLSEEELFGLRFEG